jgi:hypothetical protein
MDTCRSKFPAHLRPVSAVARYNAVSLHIPVPTALMDAVVIDLRAIVLPKVIPVEIELPRVVLPKVIPVEIELVMPKVILVTVELTRLDLPGPIRDTIELAIGKGMLITDICLCHTANKQYHC